MTGPLLGARRLRELLAAHEVHPRRSLGQNFVIDPNTIRKMVELSGVTPADSVVEIGAGAGSLTLALADVARHVTALEVDGRLVPVLMDALDGRRNVTVVEADALAFDLSDVDATSLVGNLPYNIAATIVLKVLEDAPRISQLTVMTQREVGERLAASPGDKVYGATSVLVAFWATAAVAAPVSRRAFFPVPAVDSVIVKIARWPPPPGVERDRFYAVVKAAFSQRRKTLRNALAALVGSASGAEALLRDAGLDPGTRAEKVGLDGFISLAHRRG